MFVSPKKIGASIFSKTEAREIRLFREFAPAGMLEGPEVSRVEPKHQVKCPFSNGGMLSSPGLYLLRKGAHMSEKKVKSAEDRGKRLPQNGSKVAMPKVKPPANAGAAQANPGADAQAFTSATQQPPASLPEVEKEDTVDTPIEVGVKIVSEGGRLPEYKSPGAAGADLFASEECILNPGRWALIRTGIIIEVPEGYEGQVRPRSGLSLKNGITILNAPGTIDSDYRGEVGVILINQSGYPYKVHAGDRIAQLIVAPVVRASFAEKEELSETQRGANGYGSTGGIST
jgi:dUTP pyrophosphatase